MDLGKQPSAGEGGDQLEEKNQEVVNDMGAIRITDDVVAITAGIAAMEVPELST